MSGDKPRQQPAKRVTNHDIGSRNIAFREQHVKIANGLIERVEFGPNIAPGIPGAIIGTDSRESCYLRLNEFPVEGECRAAVFDDYCWRALARAMDMKFAPANIDQLARRRGDIGRRAS